MPLQFIVLFNLILCGLNLYILWKLIQFRKYLSSVNRDLVKINYSLELVLKEIPLTILLTALEIKQFRQNYSSWKLNLKKTQKLIIIIKLIYRITKPKLI